MIATCGRALEADLGPWRWRDSSRSPSLAGPARWSSDRAGPPRHDASSKAAALDPERRTDVVVNLQGDLPTISPAAVAAASIR
jgi:hypothetical protein